MIFHAIMENFYLLLLSRKYYLRYLQLIKNNIVVAEIERDDQINKQNYLKEKKDDC